MPTMSSREFNQGASRTKRAAKSGPVFITDRGQPQHVLLSIEEYRRLIGGADHRCSRDARRWGNCVRSAESCDCDAFGGS